MAEPIEGKVAKILDEYTLIINVGAAQGVRPGMEFVVFAPGDEVVDPDSGESLGQWEAVKARLAVQHVQEKLTVCAPAAPQSKLAADDDPTTHTLSAAMIADHMRVGRSAGKINIDKSQMAGKPVLGPVSVGDSVRSVTE